MDVAALILMILAALAFVPWPTAPDRPYGWLPWLGMVLLTVGFICQFTHVTGLDNTVVNR